MADLTPAQRDALVVAEQRARTMVRQRLVDYALTVWNTLGSWRDRDIDRFVEVLAPRVLAGEQTIADLTDAYLARMTGFGRVGRVPVGDALRNVPMDEVYQRPAVEMRTGLSDGMSMTDAIKAGAVRLASLVSTDLQLANTHQARGFLTGGDIEAFERTLTGRENCGLCVVAATQRYWRGDLLPIHPGCDCGVRPLGKGEHREQVIDRAALETIHAQVEQLTGGYDRGARVLGGTNARSDYLDLIQVDTHGEYGPTLHWRHQQFTGPTDL